MRKLIDADALIEFASNHVGGMVDCNDIARFPTVDAVPVVHGRWEHHYDNYCTLTCSECGNIYQEILFSERAKYCPNCGAKMDGERKDNGK